MVLADHRMNKNPFDELFLKPGAQWLAGEWANKVLEAAKKDRVKAAMGGVIQELPSPEGRIFYIATSHAANSSAALGQTMTFRISVDGSAQDVEITSASIVDTP